MRQKPALDGRIRGEEEDGDVMNVGIFKTETYEYVDCRGGFENQRYEMRVWRTSSDCVDQS